MVNISYPFIVTNERLGRMYYPKSRGKILIYLANHSDFCNGDLNRIVKELNITILHELTHVFHEKRIRNNHNDRWSQLLKSL